MVTIPAREKRRLVGGMMGECEHVSKIWCLCC